MESSVSGIDLISKLDPSEPGTFFFEGRNKKKVTCVENAIFLAI